MSQACFGVPCFWMQKKYHLEFQNIILKIQFGIWISDHFPLISSRYEEGVGLGGGKVYNGIVHFITCKLASVWENQSKCFSYTSHITGLFKLIWFDLHLWKKIYYVICYVDSMYMQ